MAIRVPQAAGVFAPGTVIGQFVRFAGVGALATALQYVILIALVHFAAVHAPYASSLGFIISALLNYYLNYRFTFRSNESHAPAIARFFSVAGVGLALNYGVMILAVDGLNVHYLLAQIAATVLVLLWSFSANRVWTFRVGMR